MISFGVVSASEEELPSGVLTRSPCCSQVGECSDVVWPDNRTDEECVHRTAAADFPQGCREDTGQDCVPAGICVNYDLSCRSDLAFGTVTRERGERFPASKGVCDHSRSALPPCAPRGIPRHP